MPRNEASKTVMPRNEASKIVMPRNVNEVFLLGSFPYINLT
ncbi:hypothetical protein [Dulcicalothrix desertica]|nr:hypothetical protein [Dulcicalothrix desertica]